MKVNNIYNSSWFGSVLYELQGPEAVKIESSYNRGVKVMLDLPFATHRSLIEPLTGKKHIVLAKRFLLMIEKVRVSKKSI